MKILVVAPHPDDEVLGCGGTITKHSQDGHQVHLCIATKAYTPDWSRKFLTERKKEIKKVASILGVKKTYFLDFPTAKLDTIPQKDLNKAIFKVMTQVSPSTVYIPHKGDLHKDHRLIFEACLVAARPTNLKIKKIMSYESLSETCGGNLIEPFIPNIYVDISNTFRKKVRAMKAYKSELKKYPHPRSLEIIEALAKKRGSEANVKLAESFMLIKEVI